MNKKRKLVETSVNGIPTKQIGGHKYYVDSTPEKKTMSAGDYDTDGYTTHVSPDEFESMQDYDDSLGYDYEPGNEEPICYDPIDGPCYDSGDYYSKDLPLQRDYAKYRHHMSDIPNLEKKHQMDNDWSKYHNPNEIPNEAYMDLNLNTWDNRGNMSMSALSDDKAGQYGRAQTGSTLRSYLKNLKNESYKGRTNKVRLTESQLHAVIEESVMQMLSELDWKTYANAGNKMSSERGNTAYWKNKGFTPNQAIGKAANARYHAGRFYDAAKNSFKRDKGYQNGKPWDDDYRSVNMGGDFNSTEEFGPHAIGYKSKGYGNPYKYEYGSRYDGYAPTKMSPEEFYGNDSTAAQAYRDADEDIQNWKNGKSKYIKGKGWQ